MISNTTNVHVVYIVSFLSFSVVWFIYVNVVLLWKDNTLRTAGDLSHPFSLWLIHCDSISPEPFLAFCSFQIPMVSEEMDREYLFDRLQIACPASIAVNVLNAKQSAGFQSNFFHILRNRWKEEIGEIPTQTNSLGESIPTLQHRTVWFH